MATLVNREIWYISPNRATPTVRKYLVLEQHEWTTGDRIDRLKIQDIGAPTYTTVIRATEALLTARDAARACRDRAAESFETWMKKAEELEAHDGEQ